MMTESKDDDIDDKPAAYWQYSLRTLMFVVLVSAALAFISRSYFHLVIFVVIVLAAGASAVFCARKLRRHQSLGFPLCGATAVAWCSFYIASIGPAAALCEGPGVANEVCEVVYGPLIIVDSKLPSRPLDSYADEWKHMLKR